MIEKPYKGRAEVISDGINLLIKIPTKKNWFIILFLTFWIGGWFMGESTAIYALLSSESIGANCFILFWLLGWTIGGLFVIMILLWNLFGQETIQINRGILTISKGILNIFQFKKNYDLSSINNLELNPEPSEIDNYFGRNKKLTQITH